jgi:prevent-host-death family protein
MRRITASQARAGWFALLSEVKEDEQVVITRHGRAVAVLSAPSRAHRLLGLFVGKVRQNVSDDELIYGGSGWNEPDDREIGTAESSPMIEERGQRAVIP